MGAFENFINQTFAKADKDLSGALSFEEFLDVYQTICAGMGSLNEFA